MDTEAPPVFCDTCRYSPCDCDGVDPDYPQCYAEREAPAVKDDTGRLGKMLETFGKMKDVK